VISNKQHIPYFSFGEYLDEYEDHENEFKVRVFFNVTSIISPPKGLYQKFHFCYGREDIDEIFYERPLLFGIVAQAYLHELDNVPKLRLTVLITPW